MNQKKDLCPGRVNRTLPYCKQKGKEDVLVCTWRQNLRNMLIPKRKEEIMLSCSIQNVLLSLSLLSRHIHSIIFTASVHREFEPTQHSEINYYSIIIWKGKGSTESGLSSWHHRKQTPGMDGINSLSLCNMKTGTEPLKVTNVISAFLIHWRSFFIAELLNIWQYTLFPLKNIWASKTLSELAVALWSPPAGWYLMYICSARQHFPC